MLLRLLQMLWASLNDIWILPLKCECQIHLSICALRDDVLYTARGTDHCKDLDANRRPLRDEKGRKMRYVFGGIFLGRRAADCEPHGISVNLIDFVYKNTGKKEKENAIRWR
jgi:hypothetical protein